MKTNLLIAISSLSLVVSVTNLTILLIGGRKAMQAKKKIEADVEVVRTKANSNLTNIKRLIDGIEF